MGKVTLEQDVMLLFKKQLKAYAGMDQSSVRLITGEKILSGVRYSLKLGQKKIKREGQMAVGKEPLSVFHALGQEAIKEQLEESRDIWHRLQSSKLAKLSCLNIALKDSLMAELPNFFKSYDPKYFCAEIPCLIDYPLVVPIDESVEGVSYINAYLKTLEKEAIWIELFKTSDCTLLLKNLPFNVYEDLQNLFEIIFTNYLCLICLIEPNETFETLLLSGVQKQILIERWQNHPEAIQQDLTKSFQKIAQAYVFSSDCETYYEKVLEKVIQNFVRLEGLNRLDVAIIGERKPKTAEHFLGNTMADDQWRNLYHRLLGLAEKTEKIKWLKEEINHMIDLVDLIKAEALSEEDMALLLETMSAEEKNQFKTYLETFESEADSSDIHFILRMLAKEGGHFGKEKRTQLDKRKAQVL